MAGRSLAVVCCGTELLEALEQAEVPPSRVQACTKSRRLAFLGPGPPEGYPFGQPGTPWSREKRLYQGLGNV